MAQEVAHSFGLDHELLASDPMTYLDYAGERTFQDTMAFCGEYGGRMCGISGSVCRTKQNSVDLLMERVGPRPGGTPPGGGSNSNPDDLESGVIGGCNAGSSGGGAGAVLLVTLAILSMRRRRKS
jgi:uncharacterized protein (TIGR03382 family)